MYTCKYIYTGMHLNIDTFDHQYVHIHVYISTFTNVDVRKIHCNR